MIHPQRPTRCPACNHDEVCRIEYGLPAGPPDAGVVLGGCMVGPEMKQWQCEECGHRWGHVEWPSPDLEDMDRLT